MKTDLRYVVTPNLNMRPFHLIVLFQFFLAPSASAHGVEFIELKDLSIAAH